MGQYILGIDASTKSCSVALFKHGQTIVSKILMHEFSAGEKLTLILDEIIKESGIDYSNLAAIAVAKGPGSYTGLRIAVSTAKGLAFGLNIPLLSIDTLQLMCFQIKNVAENMLLCPMLDARRMEVYCGFFYSKSYLQFAETRAEIITENSFEKRLETNEILFFGEGSDKVKGLLNNKNAIFYKNEIIPNIAFAGMHLEEKFNQSAFEDLIHFEPFYLKEYMFKTKKA